MMSLDAGLRMDGILALHLWVWWSVYYTRPIPIHQQPTSSANNGRVKELRGTAAGTSNVRLRKEGHKDINLDHVATNANSSQCEAVIKMMIIKRWKSNDETRVQNSQSCS